jgi:hypothetical protein
MSLVATIPHPVYAANFTLPKAGYVYVEYVSSEAVYINDVNLVQPYASGTPLFNTKKTRLGATKLIGYYPKDTVFEFELYVRTADPSVTYRWSSDPAKNSDGENHVHTTAIDGNTYLLEWEDKPIPPGADFDDVVMLIHIGGDEDEDGLWDIWETSGVDIDLDGTIDLPIHQAPYNADPKHKDIFLEIDWMAKSGLSHKPKQKAIDLVVAAFANAPVTNPDNKDGVTLHVDMTVGGTSVPFHEYVQFEPAEPGIADFDTIKAANFDPNRRTVYHYCLFAHDLKMYPEQPSGLAERPGNDLIVAFGNWHVGATDLDKDGLPDEDVGTVLEQAGTLMHELGHNLGLRHGGNAATEYKPNYLSVMNYLLTQRYPAHESYRLFAKRSPGSQGKQSR